jgi:hypothetical protein
MIWIASALTSPPPRRLRRLQRVLGGARRRRAGAERGRVPHRRRRPRSPQLDRFATHLLGFALQGPPGLGILVAVPTCRRRSALVRPCSRASWSPRPSATRRTRVHPRRRPWRRRSRASGSAGRCRGTSPEARRRSGLQRVRPGTIAARSGDKGDHANIGVAARSPEAYASCTRHSAPRACAPLSATWSPVPWWCATNCPNFWRSISSITHSAAGDAAATRRPGQDPGAGFADHGADVPDDASPPGA